MPKNSIPEEEIDEKEGLSPVDLIEELEQKCSGCSPLSSKSDGFYADDNIFY